MVEAGRVVGELTVDAGRTYSNTLFPAVEALLDICRIEYSEISAVVVGIGPGSFTGLRIGIASAKGIAYSLEVPLIGVPSLDAMVIDVVSVQPGAVLCPMLDAKKQQVFTATYEVSGPHRPRRKGPYMAVRPEAFLDSIKGPAPHVLFGEGVGTYKGRIEAYLKTHAMDNIVLLPHVRPYPRPGAIGILGEHAIHGSEGKRWDDLFSLEPLYVRPSDAEIKRFGLDQTLFSQE